MPRTQTCHRAVSLVASFFVSFVLFEAIAEHARVDVGPMLVAQTALGVDAQSTPSVSLLR